MGNGKHYSERSPKQARDRPCAPKTKPYAATAMPIPMASRMIARRSAGQSEVTG
jgi:hypothetical protein